MTKLKTPARPQGRGVGEGNVPPRYRGGDGEGHEQPFDRFQAARLGLYIFLGAITTMFGALAVLDLLRTPARADFAFQMPKLAWISTALRPIPSGLLSPLEGWLVGALWRSKV